MQGQVKIRISISNARPNRHPTTYCAMHSARNLDNLIKAIWKSISHPMSVQETSNVPMHQYPNLIPIRIQSKFHDCRQWKIKIDFEFRFGSDCHPIFSKSNLNTNPILLTFLPTKIQYWILSEYAIQTQSVWYCIVWTVFKHKLIAALRWIRDIPFRAAFKYAQTVCCRN